MIVECLGTSSGTPTKTRNVSATVIKRKQRKSWYLVDCGEGTQHQLLKTRYSLNHLEAILITHVHGDHCYGLPGLLSSATMAGRTQTLTIIAPKPIESFIEMTLAMSESRLSYSIEFIDVSNWVGVDGEQSNPFECPDFFIQPIELSHRVPSYGYCFQEKHSDRSLDVTKLNRDNVPKGPLWGEIQKGSDLKLEDGRSLKARDYLLPPRRLRKAIICGDNDSPELLKPYIEGCHLLVHEATYTQDVAEKVGAFPQHSFAAQVARFCESVSLANLLLIHFSPRYSDKGNDLSSISDIEKEAMQHFQGNLFLGKDFDQFQINLDGSVIKLRD